LTHLRETMNREIRTLFINLPHRDRPDNFPPYGAMAVINALRKAGYRDTEFYNFDVLRPRWSEALYFIEAHKPDVLAISSPVSTGYEGCKSISHEIKKRLPGITIILGGNLSASAEIILNKTGVDFCFLGEGEIACQEFYDAYFPDQSKEGLRRIKGLAFIDQNGELIITGYADQLPKEKIFDVDWDLLDAISVQNYFPELASLEPDSGAYKYIFPDSGGKHTETTPARLKTTLGVIALSKGCFNRCTYCHRFIRGIRFLPVEIAVKRVKEMVDRFNVGAFQFADECFGASEKWLREFCRLIKPLNLLWKVGGMRVDVVTPELLAIMKDAGCRTIIYGMESGSDRILRVMEKNAKAEDNQNAARWTIDAGMQTIIALVVGMPGETPATIEETAAYVSDIMTLTANQNPDHISINFAQALPGTPLYEYGRCKNLIGSSIEGEEKYLLHVSNKNASDSSTTLNFTGYPRLEFMGWQTLIKSHVNYAYLKRYGKNAYYLKVFKNRKVPGFFNLLRERKIDALFNLYPVQVFGFRKLMWAVSFLRVLRKEGLKPAYQGLIEMLKFRLFGKQTQAIPFQYKSLRRHLIEDLQCAFQGEPQMAVLRKGR